MIGSMQLRSHILATPLDVRLSPHFQFVCIIVCQSSTHLPQSDPSRRSVPLLWEQSMYTT